MSIPPPPGNPSSSSAPPPIPPRSNEQNNQLQPAGYGGMYGGGGMYNGGYGAMGGGMYGGQYGMGGYGGGMYGGNYGSGYGGGMYGGMHPADGNFSRIAEESSRDTFRSIEAVVNAVNAVANMLSSTHNAIYSSFRAVIGVVDQFGMLKGQFTSLLLSIAIFRWMAKFWRYLLVFLRLRPANYASAAELAWGDAKVPLGTDVLNGVSPTGSSMNWPAAMFWLVALGGPYLIYKSVTRMVADEEKKRQWAIGAGPHYTAVTLFDFQAGNDQEMSFMANETLRVAPKEQQPKLRGWLLASNKEGQRLGLVPINYIRIISRQSTSPPPDGSATSLDNLNSAFHSGMASSTQLPQERPPSMEDYRKIWEENK